MTAAYELMDKEELVHECERLSTALAESNRLRAMAECHEKTMKLKLEAAAWNHKDDLAAVRGLCIPDGDEVRGYWCSCNSLVTQDDTFCPHCGTLLDWDPCHEPDVDWMLDRARDEAI